MDEIKLLKKSEIAKIKINQLMDNLVSLEIDMAYYKNQSVVVAHPQEWQKSEKGLVEAAAKHKQVTGVIKACEQVLAVYVKEEGMEMKEKVSIHDKPDPKLFGK